MLYKKITYYIVEEHFDNSDFVNEATSNYWPSNVYTSATDISNVHTIIGNIMCNVVPTVMSDVVSNINLVVIDDAISNIQSNVTPTVTTVVIEKTDDRYSLKPSPYDRRDYIYRPTTLTPLRSNVDLRKWASPVDDQFELGSCTSNAVANAYELLLNKEVPAEFKELSRLFIYYNTRKIDGDVEYDAGAYIRDTLSAVSQYGVCAESVWPYDITKFTVEPPPEAYEDAKHRKIKEYRRVNGVYNILDVLNNDIPVVFGMDVYASFAKISKDDPIVPMPAIRETSIGGHAMCLVGYNMEKQLLLAKNSFGTDWGDDGYCWIPFQYYTAYGYDSWKFDISLE